MSDAQGVKIEVEACVLEFCVVVTPNVLDLDAIVVHGAVGEASEDILHFGLEENYVHPSVLFCLSMLPLLPWASR